MISAETARQVEDLRDQLVQLLFENKATLEDSHRVAAFVAASLGVSPRPSEELEAFAEFLKRYHKQPRLSRSILYN